MTTAIHNALAAQVGAALADDLLPVGLCEAVDDAFFAHYDDHPGRHAVALTARLDGSTAVVGETYEGDEVEVVATATVEGRTVTERIPLADLWRWPAAGLELVEVEPATAAIAYFGLAESIDPRTGQTWASLVVDQRGAPVVLIDPATYNQLMTGGNDRRRVDTVEANAGGPENVRAIAAGTAQVYLSRQQENLVDDGMAPLWWSVVPLGGGQPTTSSGPARGQGGPRRYALRSRVSSRVTQDATGKARVWAAGSTWRNSTLPADDDEPGSLGRLPGGDPHLIEWQDPTGTTGAALASGMPVSDILERVVTPDQGDWRGIAAVLRRLREAGLSDRQGFMVANAKAGFSHDEIARAFGCSVSTVANTIRAGQRKLDRQQP